MKATVIADASFDARYQAAGWAAWIRVDGLPEPVKCAGIVPFGLVRSSTEAEVYAAVAGAQEAVARGARFVLVQSDCQAVCDGNHSLWLEYVEGVGKGVRFTLRHVPGHTAGSDARTWVNNWCDSKARSRMQHQRKWIKEKEGLK